MFNHLNWNTALAQVIKYILEKPFIQFSEFEVADELKETVIEEFNKYSEIFQFKNNAGEETTHL